VDDRFRGTGEDDQLEDKDDCKEQPSSLLRQYLTRSVGIEHAVSEPDQLHLYEADNHTRHNPVGKVFSRDELERIGELCVKHNLIILSDEVYDSLYYVPFTRIATLSPELWERTLTVGSAGKAFYATGWRVGYLIGP